MKPQTFEMMITTYIEMLFWTEWVFSSAEKKKAVLRCHAEMFGCIAGPLSKSSLFSHGPPKTSAPRQARERARAMASKNFIVGPGEGSCLRAGYNALWWPEQRKEDILIISSLKKVFQHFHRT